MKHRFALQARGLAPLALAFVTFAGCGKPPIVPVANQPPTVRLTGAPLSPLRRDAVNYVVTMNWIGNDPDGRIVRYLYAVDPPPDGDTVWTATQRSEQVIPFRASVPDTATGVAEDPHVFVLKAEDDRHAFSPLVTRAFFARTLAPTLQILSPRPAPSGRKYVTPSVRITWDGDDPDGVFTKKPVKYRYTLLSSSTEFSLARALAHGGGDDLRRFYAARRWAGWDSLPPETTWVQYTNLTPSEEYLFAVVAFDEAGAYSPVFTRSTNLLYFRVTYAGQNNPAFTVWNEFFYYSEETGTWDPFNPRRVIRLDIPAGRPVTVNWLARPTEGAEIRCYRWALDLVDLEDESERTGPNDLAHWSTCSANVTSATVGPFEPSLTPHRLYVEAYDTNDLRSLAVVEFVIVGFTGEHDLLVVMDTRLKPDNRLAGQSCVSRPTGQWPTQAELDTFLFARGGKPWRCYPDGVVTRPGLFAGYRFDTLGTRTGQAAQGYPLRYLANYRNVVWISEPAGTFSANESGDSPLPMNSLRWMCSPNRQNTLATYLQMGGRVWLLGGAALSASLVPYDNTANNNLPPISGMRFSFDYGELVPSRMTYDAARWRSEVRPIAATRVELRRDAAALGRQQSNPFYLDPLLPARLQRHSEAAGDSFPPNRTFNSGDFYYETIPVEYLSAPNDVQEDVDPSPRESWAPVLDTLYRCLGPTVLGPAYNPANACMTVYPSRDLWGVGDFPWGPSVIATGFDVWSWQRTQCQGVVDFVLQRLWGLPKSPVVSASAPPPNPAARVARTMPVPLDAARPGVGARRR